jgi:von Willebrand factor type A domain
MRRRRADTFGLSFLDCICCGFGAVILFYVMMSAQGGISRQHRAAVLNAEVARLEGSVTGGERELAALHAEVQQNEEERSGADADIERLRLTLQRLVAERSTASASQLAREQHIAQLQADIHALQEGERRLEAGGLQPGRPGQDERPVPGSAPRRYITGLTLHGKHVLILVDCSASMLHEDVVSIIRLRHTSDATKRAAAKWRRTLGIVDWLLTQLPAASDYQLYAFNTQPRALLPGAPGSWVAADDEVALAHAEDGLHALVPSGGTSLINAFALASTLQPRPDQIVLITDGLPTQGRTTPTQRYIDSGGRERLFDEALRALPQRVPVDTVLLPMQGDREAAHRFWYLAHRTAGSLIAPAKDWP